MPRSVRVRRRLSRNSLNSTLRTAPTSGQLSDTEQQSGPEFPTSGLATIQELIGSVDTTALVAINPSECYATTNFLEPDFATGIGPVTTNELTAAAGENRWTLDQARPLLLAAFGRQPSDEAALRKLAFQNCGTTIPSGTGKPWVRAGLGGRRRQGRKSISGMGRKSGSFGLYDFPAAAEEALHSKNLPENCLLRRAGVHYPSAGKSKRKFVLTSSRKRTL